MNRTVLVGILLAVGCAKDSGEGTVSQPALATNALATNALATNALATNALATNALATNALATNALATNGILNVAMEDPNARIFMRYLIGCAFAPGQRLEWTSRDGAIHEVYDGSIGLCPEWENGAPDGGCRQRVSACLLSRNNSFGVSVQFSMRGRLDNLNTPIQLSDRVAPHDKVFGTNTGVSSLQRCFKKGSWGLSRDCGWQVDSIGMCEPGQIVTVATGNYVRCRGEFLGMPGSANNMLRICPGTHACDEAGAIAANDDACYTQDPSTTFSCPKNGYYSVMTAAYDSRFAPDGQVGSTMIAPNTCQKAVCLEDSACCGGWTSYCDWRAEDVCRYPTSEVNVFRWREGSFYGDLFAGIDPKKPQIRVNPETLHIESNDGGEWIDDGGALSQNFIGVVYPHMHSCSSSNWSEPEAYMQLRACAGPDPKDPQNSKNCAAKWEGPCSQTCATLDMPPAGDHDAAFCAGGGHMFQQPMTTFLSGPCDAVPVAAFCATVQQTPSNW